MSISPTTYSSGELLSKLREREKIYKDANEQQGTCSNCGNGLYKDRYDKLQCENCELYEED